MKKSMIFTALLATTLTAEVSANPNQLYVTDVNPIYKTVTRYQEVPYTETVCYRYQRNPQGLLEKVVDGGFGSTGGLIGAGIGVAIGDKIGGGSGNDAAKVIGGLIGNRIGNNVSNSNSGNKTCEEVTNYVREPYQETVITGFNVTGNLGDRDGPLATVQRNREPTIGSTISVQVKVW
jgi:uncharacterized protein YcfJ